MKKRVLFTLSATLCYAAVQAQAHLPILKTHRASIHVRDGRMLYRNYWSASPDVKPDVYYAHRFSQKNTITFISDVDSITFNTLPGRVYPFIILLDGKDSCFTEISTIRQTYYRIDGHAVTSDTIPFSLGRDGRVYLEGSINNSAPLRFFFDNGADNTVVFPSAFQKGLKVSFDDSIANNGTGGTAIRRTSNHASVQLGNMRWDHELVMEMNKNLGDNADGTIGYDLFENKVVEIDYDKMLFIVHDKGGTAANGYQMFAMHFGGGQVPSITVSLIPGDTTLYRDFIFDMGATGCLFINSHYSSSNGLYEKLRQSGESTRSGAGSTTAKTLVAILPKLKIGRFRLHNLPVNLQDTSAKNGEAEEIGMDILKRFNTILDYKHQLIYLKPNHLLHTPYKSYKFR